MDVEVTRAGQLRRNLVLHAFFSNQMHTGKKWTWIGRKGYGVTFGLNGGYLAFDLEKMRAPLKDRLVGTPNISESVELTRKSSHGKAIKSASTSEDSLSLKMASDPSLEIKDSYKSEHSQENKSDGATEFKDIHVVVKTAGTETKPIWTFEAPDLGAPLYGWAPGGMRGKNNPPLAKLTMEGLPRRLSASFYINSRNILITQLDAADFSEAPPVTLAVAKAALLKAIRKKLEGSGGVKCISSIRMKCI